MTLNLLNVLQPNEMLLLPAIFPLALSYYKYNYLR